MPSTASADGRSALFGRRNYIVLAVAVATIGAGYAMLVSGAAGAASIMLVVGYCILFPVALVV